MNSFAKLLTNNEEYKSVRENLIKNKTPLGILGLSGTSKAHVISSLVSDINKKALIITPDEKSASAISSDMNVLGVKADVFPSRQFNFRSDESSSKEYERKRIGTLEKILTGEIDAVVCSAEAAMQPTMPPEVLREKSAVLKTGTEISIDRLISVLVFGGYARADLVDGKGQFSSRGDIVDFFPPENEYPVRIEFFGEEIDRISYFDPESQRKTDDAVEIRLSPACETVYESAEIFADKTEKFAQSLRGKKNEKAKQSLLDDASLVRTGVRLSSIDKYMPLIYGKKTTVFDYCSDFILFVSETSEVKRKADEFEKNSSDDIKILIDDGVLCKGLDDYFLKRRDLFAYYEMFDVVYADNFARGSFDTPVKDLITFNANQHAPWEGSASVLSDDLKPLMARGYTSIVLAGTDRGAKALSDDLLSDGFDAVYFSKLPDKFIKKKVNVISGALNYGIDYPNDKIIIITTGRYMVGSVASARRRKRYRSKNREDAFNSIDDLTKGDLVVHSVHGIGIFDSITSLTVDGVIKDFIKIQYAGSGVLYVPVSQLDMLSKYIGPSPESGAKVKISKLGSLEWKHKKQKVKAEVRDMAEQLAKLYAKRKMTKGYAFSPDIDMQSDFERRFEFDETDDQLSAVYEIKKDMEKPYPMDRLLCGDVGFGKTEVALRAAFKAVADGKQAAILVPTTILCLQHYRTVMRRFEGFPINIEMLSKFRNIKQRKEIKKRLAIGDIDIIIGTHTLFAKDVKFKDLGLLVIDEEQRFGVAQKEKIKAAHPAVDVLTMSATPIPRTLNMALSGIRDMSVLEEPPVDRVPVQTYVLEYDMGILSEAMNRELRRGGQIYYLHNRVDDIDEKAAEIHKFLPDARIGIAHGQMTEDELTESWRKLVEGETDILVCTTIIETGVDVPNVNTLIIENANRMGLAQLHQIRGRVGRSSRRAYAYLTYPKDKSLTEQAMKRLNAIREFTEFGSGFKIAMKDLEIRGAGNILGSKQSGHLEAVGYDMYMQLLNEVMEEIKTGEKPEEEKTDMECLIELKIDAHIPEDYIPSVPQRISIYRKIASIDNTSDAKDILNELSDRYGNPPETVNGLITVSLIRHDAMKHGIFKISEQDGRILFYFYKLTPDLLKAVAKASKSKIIVGGSGNRYVSLKKEKDEGSLNLIKRALEYLDEAEKDATAS